MDLCGRFSWCSVPKKNVGVAADCFNRSNSIFICLFSIKSYTWHIEKKKRKTGYNLKHIHMLYKNMDIIHSDMMSSQNTLFVHN